MHSPKRSILDVQQQSPDVSAKIDTVLRVLSCTYQQDSPTGRTQDSSLYRYLVLQVWSLIAVANIAAHNFTLHMPSYGNRSAVTCGLPMVIAEGLLKAPMVRVTVTPRTSKTPKGVSCILNESPRAAKSSRAIGRENAAI